MNTPDSLDILMYIYLRRLVNKEDAPLAACRRPRVRNYKQRHRPISTDRSIIHEQRRQWRRNEGLHQLRPVCSRCMYGKSVGARNFMTNG